MDHALLALAQNIGLTALDVGARGGVNTDLGPVAEATKYVGFEPDAVECARLQNAGIGGGWKQVQFVPVALADYEGTFDLNLYSKRGCSSKYRARQDLGKLFCRGEFYNLDQIVKVPCSRLDDVLHKEGILEPAFMKIDVQSMEVEVFNGAPRTLKEDLVGIRTEVSFFPMYEEQPLFAEIDQRVRQDGFVPMRWLENHEWRRATGKKPYSMADGPLPFSRGQLMHADVLYLLHPEALPTNDEKSLRRLVRLGLVASCYQHYDHAMAAFARPYVRQLCQDQWKIDPFKAVERMSQAEVTLTRRLAWRLMKTLQKNFA
ncbi:methyltransferase, FkbM family [Prosthecobacter debontii]|uniref:Methyltransferase, FkbM family n=1 Tax=Prosthecobacter debontii TaxID=48467 RepID=A0A1T4XTR1_9BACT|nr:FkbM family methyltransferase [Prosthecobacter debontii]SKA92904.1 methyltransferase, FkbM family [Prosthecobacter debontii]